MRVYNYTAMEKKRERYKLLKSQLYASALFLLLFVSIVESKDKYLEELIHIPVSIENNLGEKIEFKAYIAQNYKQKRKGLMYIENLPENESMLFHFNPPRDVSMWMKNTVISLDIIFLDSNKKIIKIHRNAEPESLKSIRSVKKAEWVLEINAGVSENYKIDIGNIVSFEVQNTLN